ncbi:MAG: serine/threonine protein kinase, partial [Deltaproteobacteria bacterium]|nr:serine/threonine protein kinase [Deltaproteobacteria bacterium]
MAAEQPGICPNCETRRGPVGDACPSDVCKGKSYHFIPYAWFESSKQLSIRKRRPMDPLLGRYINRYLLAGKLGEGGMGAVYVAIQKPLGREVALKLISGVEISGAAIARFEREARAIALLDHPNIVKLHDYGIGDLEFQVPFMAIEYVRHGRTLRRAFAAVKKESGGQIPGDVVLTIFRQILNALSAAHGDGLIHRDMKPDNVLIMPVAGNPYLVKVLDFGLAKAVSEVSGFDGDLSHTGLVLGTPYYMAPEQAPTSGRSLVDARADLYAVTVMLYEVFTGIRPFSGDSALAILTQKTDPNHRPMDF